MFSVNQTRAFGCPSVRTDLPMAKSGRRSMADSQNYGDDPSAKELICPPPFSELNFSADIFSTPLEKSRLVELFDRMGYPLPEDVSEWVFQEAVARTGLYSNKATFNDFRDVANDYYDACDTGREAEWRDCFVGHK